VDPEPAVVPAVPAAVFAVPAAAAVPVPTEPASAQAVEPPDAGSPPADPPAEPAADVPDTVLPSDTVESDGSSRRPLAALLPIGLLALGALLLVAGTVFLGLQVRAESRTEDARTQALAASRDAARALFSYNHESLEQDFARGLAVTTGNFREEYSRTTTDVVQGVATEYQAVVQANVSEAGVISAGPDEVVVLVFINQVTTSTRVEGEKIDQSRVRMRLVRRGGDWLVAQVDAL
jgi:Mce-associated membrane protein